MNIETIEKLQLNEVKELIKGYCVSTLGKILVDKVEPSGNFDIVNRRLNDNKEARKILNNSTHVPLEGIGNITPILEKVEKGMILEPNELTSMEDFLRGCKKIKVFMDTKEFYAPKLSSYALNISLGDHIENEISYCIKNNKVSSDASKELKKIRRNIEVLEGKIKERLNKFLTSSVNKKYIQDFIISKRDDRYVIPIKSSYKNEVDGIVLDTSSKGNTVFVEPSSVSKFSLELISLRSEEVLEEYKILSNLTELIFQDILSIKLNVEVISEYDMVFAKAKYSQNIKAITPKINNYGYINIIEGKHPLLKGDVVPLNFSIGKDYRGLIITGPNAGGKTISLKVVGLFTLMTQCGFDIPCKENTEISVFENVFIDIGDNQSIENSLSTFSSHMKNIGHIMKKCNKSTIVLFDEICSGTEPNEGAALAIAILEEFYRQGCIIVASTHYGEIKKFATMHSDFQNAGMMFDKDTLEPMYKLTIGKSEDSNALFISRKMGIKEVVLKNAREYIDNKSYNLEVIKKGDEVRQHIVEDNRKIEQEEYLLDDTDEAISYEIGDKVKLLEQDDYAVVYKPADKFNNIKLLYKDEFIDINIKRIRPHIKAKDLYPEGYDLDSLFIDFKDRKLEKDIIRGSKKALKKIRKEMKNNKEQ